MDMILLLRSIKVLGITVVAIYDKMPYATLLWQQPCYKSDTEIFV